MAHDCHGGDHVWPDSLLPHRWEGAQSSSSIQKQQDSPFGVTGYDPSAPILNSITRGIPALPPTLIASGPWNCNAEHRARNQLPSVTLLWLMGSSPDGAQTKQNTVRRALDRETMTNVSDFQLMVLLPVHWETGCKCRRLRRQAAASVTSHPCIPFSASTVWKGTNTKIILETNTTLPQTKSP